MRKRVRLVCEEELQLGGMLAYVRYKNIKNLYLRVRPPDGHVELSVPQRTTRAEMEDMICRRRSWIEERRRQIRMRGECPPPAYREGETVLLWGQEHPIVYAPLQRGRVAVMRADSNIVLRVPVDASPEMRRRAVDAFYRTELAAAIERLAPVCEEIVGKHAARWRIRAMRTRWGSCNVGTAAITLNLHLARYDERALRYVILHELTHLWVRGHDAHFYARMDRYFPGWQEMRRTLNDWAHADQI